MKKYIISLVLIIITVIFILGFIEVDNSPEVKKTDGIVYSLSNINTNYEKITGLSQRDEDIICATSRGLVYMNNEGKIMPSIAEKVDVREDGIEYEFTISDNVYWSNGDKITPNDVRDFFKELIKNEDEENIQSLLDVFGARAFKDGTGNFDGGVAITATENTVKFRLNKKNDNLLEDLTKPQYRIRKFIPLWGNIKDTYSDLVYSGEYSISYVDEESIKLKINNNVNGPEEITFIKDKSEELAMAAYEIGKRDIVLNPPNSQLSKLEGDNKLLTYSSDNGYFLHLNSDENGLPLSARKEIYKNIYLATEEFMDLNTQRVESAEGSYFLVDKEDVTKLQTRKVSVNEGASIENIEYLTMVAIDSDESRDLCKYLVTYFKDKLNINLRYSLVKEEDLEDEDLIKRYNLVLIERNADPSSKKEFFNGIKKYLTEEEQKYLETEEYAKLEEVIFENCSLVPIMFSKNNIAISTKVDKVTFDGHGNIIFTN